MDFSGYPFPENSPEPGACIRIERPEAGLAVLVLDPPHRSLAVLDAPLMRDLAAAIEELEGDSSLQGVVITGRSPVKFAAGADIDAIKQLTDIPTIEQMVLAAHALLFRIAALKPRTIAAVGGPVPGGAYELSLSCDRILVSDDPKTRIGLPETQLGILPGWGGCHRLPRRVGVPTALDAILTGRLYPARTAWKRGMVDRVVPPEYLLRVACDAAMGRIRVTQRKRGLKGILVDRNPMVANFIADQARKAVMKKTRGRYPAPLRALELAAAGPRTSLRDGARKEAVAIAELASGPICKALVGIFQGSELAKKTGKLADGSFPPKVTKAAVIGGGTMGAGIASSLADKGVATRLTDLDPAVLDTALAAHRADLAKKLKRRRLRPHLAAQAVDHLDTTPDSATLRGSDILIEAVAEVLEVKQSVFGSLAKIVRPDCILATNTSSLSVTEIAKTIPHPERVVGMHFFNPVKRMPLVEVVRGEQTSDEVVTATCALALRLGKTPVVTADVAGFLVNRLLCPYLDEAQRLFLRGISPVRLDSLMLNFGMPMGPFALLDEVGLDIAAHAGASLHAAYGARMTPAEGLMDQMGPKRLGKKTGRGFYDHSRKRKGKKPPLCEDIRSFQSGNSAKSLCDRDLVARMVLSMANEAVRCLEEQVVANAAMLDLATVFGTGFAPFRGGVLAWLDAIGADEAVRRLKAIADSPEMKDRPGAKEKFAAAPLLREMAESGTKFRS